MSRRLALIEAERYALAHSPPPPELARRIRALETENAVLRRQLADRSAQAPEPLASVNETRRADGARLDAAITAALAADPASGTWTAKEVGKALERAEFSPLPARRTIADHLKALRNRGGTVRRLRND